MNMFNETVSEHTLICNDYKERFRNVTSLLEVSLLVLEIGEDKQWTSGDTTTSTPAAGDLTVASAGGLRRVVLVTAVAGDEASVLLTTSRLDMATDFDVVIEVAGLDRVVVQAELYATVLCAQLGPRLASVAPGLVKALVEALWDDGSSLAGWTVGPPLSDISQDVRRQFKQAELDALIVLRGAHAARHHLGPHC